MASDAGYIARRKEIAKELANLGTKTDPISSLKRNMLKDEDNRIWQKMDSKANPGGKFYESEAEKRKDFNVNIKRLLG